MCRPSAQGGRRCSGSTRTSTHNGPSRNWDGSPETDADRRFHDLRDSGYTGPIDENGSPVAEGHEAEHLLVGRDRL
jgi:hypothetical protein